MNAPLNQQLCQLIGLLITFALAIIIIGVGFSYMIGGSAMAKRFTNWFLKTFWKITRRILKAFASLAADFFKWLHSKL